MTLDDRIQEYLAEHPEKQWIFNCRGKSMLDEAAAIKPIPKSDWPPWAKAVSKFAIPDDKGIGDVIARKIGAENSAAFKAWYEMTFGKPCGCTGRHAQYNLLYPLP